MRDERVFGLSRFASHFVVFPHFSFSLLLFFYACARTVCFRRPHIGLQTLHA